MSLPTVQPVPPKNADGVAPLLLGAAWYPELWDRETQKRDVELMLEAGCNTARLAEFAWAFMEPHEGDYRWDWLHDACRLLHANSLHIVMCTPTATPPIWLTEKHPEMLLHHDDAPTPMTHGARRHYSPHSEVYIEHCRRIVDTMAGEFAGTPGIITWQIDNEVSGAGEYDVSPTAKAAFARWLETKFGDIENFNDAINAGVWSQRYQRFEQAPLPVRAKGMGHNPLLRYQFLLFTAEAWSRFIGAQAEVLREHVDVPITSNFIPFQGSDQFASARHIDFLSIDNYCDANAGELFHAAWEYDWMRAAKRDRAPWAMETWPTTNGGNTIGIGAQPENADHVNAWIPIALGGEAVLFWLWRLHRGGQETQHGAVIYTWGEPTYGYANVQRLARDFRRCEKLLREHPVQAATVAMQYDWQNNFQLMAEPMYREFTGTWTHRPLHRDRYYKALLRAHLHREIVSTHEPPADHHRVVLAPWLPMIPKQTLEQFEKWVRSGGTWVLGPCTGIRDELGRTHTTSAYDMLEQLLGVRCVDRVGQQGRTARVKFADGHVCDSAYYADSYEAIADDVEVHATYEGWPHDGRAAIVSRRLGQGRIVYVGTTLETSDLAQLCQDLCHDADVSPVGDGCASALVVPRGGEPGAPAVTIVLETEGHAGSLQLHAGGVDVLRDERVADTINVEPYDVRVIEHN